MTSTGEQRKHVWIWVSVAAACGAWLAWLWSPNGGLDLPRQRSAPQAAAAAGAPAAAPSQSASPPQPPPPKAAERAAPSVPETTEHTAAAEPRVLTPSPHPMSLDQAKPPEQQGALGELKQQYAGESRGADSSALESKLRGQITNNNIPAELIQSLTCRRRTCRIEARWTPQRRIGYVLVYQGLKTLYQQRIAVEPADAAAADGSYLTTLFVQVVP